MIFLGPMIEQRQAAHDRADGCMLEQPVHGKLAGIDLENARRGETGAQERGELRAEFHQRQILLPDAAADEGLREHARAGSELDDRSARGIDLARDEVGERRARRHHRAHASGIGGPGAQESAASRRAISHGFERDP